jgi:hypothetical protein
MAKPKLDAKIFMMLMERGEIIISAVQVVEKGYIFITPGLVIVERTPHGPLGFALISWLPNELMENSCIIVSANRVVGIMSPAKQLIDFYTSWALTERDKMAVFAKDFETQIAAIQKYHADKYAKTKERKKKGVFVDSTSVEPLPDFIIEMFEKNNDWVGSTANN